MVLTAGGAQVTEYRDSSGIFSFPKAIPLPPKELQSLFLLITLSPSYNNVTTGQATTTQLINSYSFPAIVSSLYRIIYFPTEPGAKLRSLNPVSPSGI